MRIPGLQVDLESSTPVYRQIADSVRAALRDGRLRTGRRLPPTRDLARELGVNRNTVVAAYELLAGDGLVESRAGRGTFVVSDRPGTPAGPATAAAPGNAGPEWQSVFSRAADGPGLARLRSIYSLATSHEGISFAGTYPAPELMPVRRFREAMDAVLTGECHRLLAYGPTAGYGPLKETIAASMREKGSPVREDGLLVTNGGQQALDLVFRALLDRGDAVVLEEPTYTGALGSLASLGARMVGVPLDENGVRTDLLAEALERHRPRLIYLQPNFQNPTTRVLSATRRREVLALAARHRCVVVEDDWAADLDLDGGVPPTLHALDGGRRVIYLSSFSKKLLPGLRLGWLAAPPAVLEGLIGLKQVQDFGSSQLIQAALHRFLADGGLPEHLNRVLPHYRERRDAMLASLARHFPPEVHWTRPSGGLFVWVMLPPGSEGGDLLVAARERGVLFSPGELFHAGGTGRETLRLTYSGETPERIETGIAVLGELIRERWPDGFADRSVPPAESVPIL